MATKVTTSNQLKMIADFDGNDSRTITLNNPKPNLTPQDITTFATAATNVLIGDKAGGVFTGIRAAAYVETAVHDLDLTPT